MFCEERVRLAAEWVAASENYRQALESLTNLSQSSRSQAELEQLRENIEVIRLAQETARRSLDPRRQQHGC